MESHQNSRYYLQCFTPSLHVVVISSRGEDEGKGQRIRSIVYETGQRTKKSAQGGIACLSCIPDFQPILLLAIWEIGLVDGCPPPFCRKPCRGIPPDLVLHPRFQDSEERQLKRQLINDYCYCLHR